MLRRGAATALIATAAALPFELRATLPLGPLRLSSVEVFLYATLALWLLSCLVDPARRRPLLDPRCWPPALLAAAGLEVVLALSALRAPELRVAACKFALRSASGIALAFAAADLLRAPALRRRVLVALVAGVTVAGGAVLVEATWPAAASLLRPFHEQTFQALGQVRGSGPFQFPNIAAMALEAAIPLALWFDAPGAVAAVVLFSAVIATSSRAGLVTAAVAALATAVVWASEPARRRSAWILALACVGLSIVGTGRNSALLGRLAFWKHPAWYRARIVPAGGLADRLAPGQSAVETLTVTNEGALTWHPRPPFAVALSYHWTDAKTGLVEVRDGLRTVLPAEVPPRGSVTLPAAIVVPSRPGRYVLSWDLVQEDVTWFRERGSAGLDQLVGVGETAPGLASLRGRLAFEPALDANAEDVSRARLWAAAAAMFRAHPLLGVGPDNFRHLYNRYLTVPAATNDRLHANSLYFETLADLGLMGVVAWFALGLALAAAVRRSYPNLQATGVSIALGTFLLHGTLDYFFAFTPTLAMFWLLAGALVALDPRTSELAA